MASADELIEKGQELLEKGDYKKAFNTFEKALNEDPKNASAHFGKAEATVGLPKITPQEAGALYRQAIEADPENAFFYTSYADFCLSNGWLKPAEENYLKAAEVDPDNEPMYLNDLAVGYYESGTLFLERQLGMTREDIARNAITYALKAYGLDPDGAKSLFDEMSSSEQLSKPKTDPKDVEDLSKEPEGKEMLGLIEKEPGNPLNLLTFGQMCIERGKLDTGAAYFYKAIDQDPDNSKYFFSDLAVGVFISGRELAEQGKAERSDIQKRSLYYCMMAMGFEPTRAKDILYG